jgi:2-oxoisovalerate dehydrogenase E2 component (dihydrolipoyl transacylase)
VADLVIKLPDVGEGVAEAEITELLVSVGDRVSEDQPLVAVLTDKATVEIPSPATGTVTWIGIAVGDVAAVGSPLLRVDTDMVDRGEAVTSLASAGFLAEAASAGATPVTGGAWTDAQVVERPLASPAVRAHAREKGIDLGLVRGTGPAGRILRSDLDTFVGSHAATREAVNDVDGVEEIRLSGLRRAIARRVQESARQIPHFSYIEEIDVTDLEALRADLNAAKGNGRPHLTVLPFVMRAIAHSAKRFPDINARFDETTETLSRYAGVHLGIATQTAAGLVVPVIRDVSARSLWSCAEEVARLAASARAGHAGREELTGSTLTITSLGALGGVATTPIINAPEVAIVGVNRISTRPVWRGDAFAPRKMMNLSSSFDHRVVDGWTAAEFIQALRELLERPVRILV